MSTTLHMPRILVVEDETLVRFALCEFLASYGIRVLEAVNADQALTVLKRLGSRVELLLTDIRMPGAMDGLGLTAWVHRYLPQMPVIVTTGDIGSPDRKLDLAPRDALLLKPYSFDKVARKILERCRR
jgi:CheY-like chemotaxis protein